MARHFIFWSWTYATGTVMSLLFAGTLAGLSVIMRTWFFAVLGVPVLAASFYLARRTRVAVSREGETVTILAGVGPKTTLKLGSGRTLPAGLTYRSAEARPINRADVEIVDHAEVDGPVIKERTRLTRGVGRVVRALKFVFSDYAGGSLSGPKVREKMGIFRVVTADGRRKQFIVPAEGDANAKALAELLAALGPDEA